VCVRIALVNQHLKRKRITLLLSVACTALPYFSLLSHKTQLSKKVIEQKICVLIYSTLLTNISHYRKTSARYCHKST
jgi:hypothetical protein